MPAAEWRQPWTTQQRKLTGLRLFLQSIRCVTPADFGRACRTTASFCSCAGENRSINRASDLVLDIASHPPFRDDYHEGFEEEPVSIPAQIITPRLRYGSCCYGEGGRPSGGWRGARDCRREGAPYCHSMCSVQAG